MFFFSSTSKKIILFAFVLSVLDFSRGLSSEDYLKLREKAIRNEEASSFGANLSLNKHEVTANRCLMSFKQTEIDEGYKNLSRFWPAMDFLQVRKDIEQTETFKILRLMPKGAVLHTHIGATASLNFVYENLTTLPYLHVCLENNTVQFRFFEEPDENCNWRLMKYIRENSPETIEYIKKHLSLPNQSTPGYNLDLFWSKFNEMWEAFDGIIRYRPAFELYTYHSLEELYEDNIMYLETRSDSYKLYELNGTTHDPSLAFRIFKQVVNEFVATHPGFMGAKIMYNVARSLSHEEFEVEVQTFRRIKRLLPDLVVGFDVLDQEDKGHPNVYFVDQLLGLKNETSFYFHVGQTKWFGHPVDENLFDAVLLNAKRIGHGYALAKHPKLLEMVKEKDIAVEVNPISSQLGHFPDLRDHPASHFFAKNLAVVVSNDEPAYYGASGLSYDFYQTFIGIMSRKADLRSLKQLAINSITYSAMTEEEKKRAYQIWSASWMKFVMHLAYEYNCSQKNVSNT